jgi:hypothetical protein
MNINEYISSGILEQYIAGTTTVQETQEVACMSHIYPEIYEELQSIQQSLEVLAQAEAINPPAHLRKNIFDTIDSLENNPHLKDNKLNQVSIKPSSSANLSFSKNKLGYKSAAAILLFINAGLGYLLYNTNKTSDGFANDLALVKKEIIASNNLLQNKEVQISILKDKSFQTVAMAGLPAKDTSFKANIYFSKTSQQVFVALENLPQPMPGKQYQLWAIADGKPVDLGMLYLNQQNNVLQKMKGIKNPQAFAITLEKEGGVPIPTMQEMVVMGGV